MKKFECFDVYGKKRIFCPSDFVSSSSVSDSLLVGLSEQSCIDLIEYARKAHLYIFARLSKRQVHRDSYCLLANRISLLSSCGFPGTPIYEVLHSFGEYVCSKVYTHHVAFCRGYVPVKSRKNPPVEFYFGTFGGGFCFYEYFSTRFRYRHLILLSSWWFVNSDIASGVSDSKVALFERFCKNGELSISS